MSDEVERDRGHIIVSAYSAACMAAGFWQRRTSDPLRFALDRIQEAAERGATTMSTTVVDVAEDVRTELEKMGFRVVLWPLSGSVDISWGSL